MEGLLASGGPLAPSSPGWPAWVADAVQAFGPGLFQGAMYEALADTPSFGAPPPPGSLDARIDRLYSGLASAGPETGAVVASLFDGLLSALGQWLSSVMSLGWRSSTLLGGDVLAVTVFDLALTPDNPLPADSTVQLDITVSGRASAETTRMWDRRGRANTRFHHYFDQLVHVDLDSEDRAVDLAFAASIYGSLIPSVSAHAPSAVGDSAQMFHSAVLLDAAGAAVGEIRFDARRLGRAAAAEELATSGLWTDQAAAAYANALGVSMVGPALSRLRSLAPSG